MLLTFSVLFEWKSPLNVSRDRKGSRLVGFVANDELEALRLARAYAIAHWGHHRWTIQRCDQILTPNVKPLAVSA